MPRRRAVPPGSVRGCPGAARAGGRAQSSGSGSAAAIGHDPPWATHREARAREAAGLAVTAAAIRRPSLADQALDPWRLSGAAAGQQRHGVHDARLLLRGQSGAAPQGGGLRGALRADGRGDQQHLREPLSAAVGRTWADRRSNRDDRPGLRTGAPRATEVGAEGQPGPDSVPRRRSLLLRTGDGSLRLRQPGDRGRARLSPGPMRDAHHDGRRERRQPRSHSR